MILPYDEDSFIVHTDIKTEQPAPFFGWLFQFGDKAEIITPINLREEFQKMLRKVSELYI
jgi:predicted DNA-binding transcriptional regulator YafY